MSDSLWPYWIDTQSPGEGVYELVMITGLVTSNEAVPEKEKTLYVCKSREGGLSVAFAWTEIQNGRMRQCRENGGML